MYSSAMAKLSDKDFEVLSELLKKIFQDAATRISQEIGFSNDDALKQQYQADIQSIKNQDPVYDEAMKSFLSVCKSDTSYAATIIAYKARMDNIPGDISEEGQIGSAKFIMNAFSDHKPKFQ
jgi:hypothetical protein